MQDQPQKLHLLNNRWTVYEGYQDGKKDYKDSIQKVTTFESVEELGYLQEHTIYGKIKDIFTAPGDGRYKTFTRFNPENPIADGDEFQINSLCIFKNDIQPTWEDPENSQGGIIQFEVKADIYDKVEDLYRDLIYNIVGEKDHSLDQVNGVRIVDKLNIKTNPNLRFEIWIHFDPNSNEDNQKHHRQEIQAFLFQIQSDHGSSNVNVKTTSIAQSMAPISKNK